MSTDSDIKNMGYTQQQVKRIFYRRLGGVIWLSFLMAAIEGVIFFAFIDPKQLAQLSSLFIDISRMQGYTYCFLFFWVFTFVTGLFCGVSMVLPRAQLAKNHNH